ncbi:3-keto-5-aminohexanoate cleavage protein [bacterium]|nr:3-keto-5-aminohexanoate cleavage protein [bacterium]
MIGGRLIAVAPNGARKTRADHPRLPIEPDEIAAEARACRDAGAAMLHLHVRDAEGRHSLDAGRYREAIAAVVASVGRDLIIQITTEAVGVYGVEDQFGVVEALRPEACSVALREALPPGGDGPGAALDRYLGFLRDCRREGIGVQHILYDVADVRRFNALRTRDDAADAFGPHPFVLLVVGRYSPNGASDPIALGQLASALMEPGAPSPLWGACAFGPAETSVLLAAAGLGGHIRVGFENNLHHPSGAVAESNAERVGMIAGLVGSAGFSPLSADQARAMIANPGETRLF